jgi:putative protease
MGANKFGAREAAGNSLQDIEKATKYAHKYGAKLLLTLNTILYDNELEEARKMVVAAYNMGCDALIIQDMAFLEMDLPPIPLHASTQTNNATPEKVKFLEGVGFQRVVLARELSTEEITNIRKATHVELESFIHGALCVSYSGQCYLSQALTGRSANRGACAQPCRSSYNLKDSTGSVLIENKHLLSLKDLNMSNHIQRLAEAGVQSFKIEGRLKNVDYVKNIVSYYRKIIDSLPYFKDQKSASSGDVKIGFNPNPEKTFSRGYTSYFAKEIGQMASFDTQKSIGEYIGKITSIDGNNIIIDIESEKELHNGDGICFFNESMKLQGTNINQVNKNKIKVQDNTGATAGSKVYRNLDVAFKKDVERSVGERRIGVKINFIESDNFITLEATTCDSIKYSITESYNKIPAKNTEKSLLTIKEQLSKSGSFIFKIEDVEINTCNIGFYTMSQLNSWRRKLLEGLEKQCEKAKSGSYDGIKKNTLPYPSKTLDYRGNVSNHLARQFYERHGVTSIGRSYEESPVGKAELMVTRYCILRELGWCKKESTKKIKEPLYLENNGQMLELHFDCKNCRMTITNK